MEKLMGPPTNEKISDHIPDDLAFSILSKLPLKSWSRFRCVHKSWSHLSENPNFMSMYRKNFISGIHSSYGDGSCLLLKQTLSYYHCVLYFLSGGKFKNIVKLDWPPPFQGDNRCIYILGSVINGVVCLHQRNIIVLWNPATEEFKVLPPSPTESLVPYETDFHQLHGFGFDQVRDDYKVIRHVTYHLDLTDYEQDMADQPVDLYYEPIMSRGPVWEIYSLRSNSWRKLDVDMPNIGYQGDAGTHVYINGVCHWWDEDSTYLVSFDLGSEVFFTTLLPSDMDNSFGFVMRHMAVLNESIALISNYKESTTFHISILGELGVKESWAKIFIVGPLSCVEHPVGVGKKGDLFFRRTNDELVWFDLSTQMIEELGVKGQSFLCQIVIYKESFLPIGEIND